MNGEALLARELQVLRLAADGLSNLEIGGRLGISEEATKTAVRRLMRKLDALNRAHAVALGFRSGLIETGRPAVVVPPAAVPRPGLPDAVVAELVAVAEQVVAGKPSSSLRGQAGRALVAAGRRSPLARVSL